MPACDKCNRDFKTEMALRVHGGRSHYVSIDYTCPICKRNFKCSKSKSKRVYCSAKCKYKGLKKRYRGKSNPSYKGGCIEKKCLNCGKIFKAERWHSKRYAIYCSLSCSSKKMWNAKPDKRRLGYKGTRFRTELEYKYAVWLDSYKLTWFYEPKTFQIGGNVYTPDFYIKEWNTFVDIPRRITRNIQRKIEAFKTDFANHDLKVMSPEELELIINQGD